MIVLHLLLDFWLALLFLVGLALLLYYAVNYYNTLVPNDLHIPIAQMMQNTLKNPLSLDNAWITFMLASTLVPTVLHFIFAIINFILYITQIAPWYANRIEKSKKYPSQRMLTAFLMSAPMALISFFVLYAIYLISIKIINNIF